MTTLREVKTYQGSCHCQRVRFEVRTELTRVSECNCSIFRRKGYLHHMVTPDRFRLIQGEADLATSGPSARFTTSATTAALLPSIARERILPITWSTSAALK